MITIDIVADALGGMSTTPRGLDSALKHYSEEIVGEEELFEYLKNTNSSDEIFILLNRKLSGWDYESSAKWIDKTSKNTIERRQKIYDLLKVSKHTKVILEEKFPPNLSYEAPIVIANKHEPWYDSARQSRHSFYRDSYSNYLRQNNGWKEEQIRNLEESTRLVVERLSDPERDHIYPVKGLVVGYVQSGKTTNFTGVIARAADAGYRLIIVLAGTMDILRSQTQRRIDRELIGRPFITEEDEPIYATDIENFVNHGVSPSAMGSFDWHRLTGIGDDYKRLKYGIQSLEFNKRDKTKAFNDAYNLHPEKARILIIKKHPGVIARVAKDLEAIKEKSKLADIPTLIIDDESDQASVNTKRPTTKEIKDRTATNLAIVSLIKQLPRAQYVGYTATPFANVFVDPNLIEDLFPRDFIISLPRPENYMGVSDFHDLDISEDDKPGPNESAFVRNVKGQDDKPENLQEAIDSYVLSGAIKLYRQKLRPELEKRFRHHTMLVHSSQSTGDHTTMAKKINFILDNAGYMTGAAWERLEVLWNNDFAKHCSKHDDIYPTPQSFAEIEPFLGETWGRLTSGSKRVLIVNGDKNDNPNFESENIWKIVVGGAKLSRGYTIEGLTTSYYRRRAGAADTLMQMGRWFGYRNGYRDLVRLYIGREEQQGRKIVDLYKAFEAVCRDEMDFREELKRYATSSDGSSILPIQIPPLVPCHLLQPTAKNKMYNAVVEFQNFSQQWIEPTIAPFDEPTILKNQKLLEDLLKGVGTLSDGELSVTISNGKKVRRFAKWGIASSDQMLKFLSGYRWLEDKPALQRQIEFLTSKQATSVEEWLFLFLDVPDKTKVFKVADQEFRIAERSRVSSEGRFNAYSGSMERPLVEYLCGFGDSTANNMTTGDLRSEKRGIFVFYPTQDKNISESLVTPGFALQFPSNTIPTPIRFGVRVKEKPNAIVVEGNIT